LPGVKVAFDRAGARARIEKRISQAQAILDGQVMKDSNYFIPKRDGDLEKSVLGSQLGSGLLVWAIEYARKLYHGVGFRFSKDVNPNASPKWFERAKAQFKDKWVKLVNDEYSR
jgi:hypothetical protein